MTLRFEARASAFQDAEDVYDGERYLGWFAPSARRDGYWFASPIGAHCESFDSREAAVKHLQNARSR